MTQTKNIKILPHSNGHKFDVHWTTIDKWRNIPWFMDLSLNFFFGFNNAQFVRESVQAVSCFQPSSAGLQHTPPVHTFGFDFAFQWFHFSGFLSLTFLALFFVLRHFSWPFRAVQVYILTRALLYKFPFGSAKYISQKLECIYGWIYATFHTHKFGRWK